MKRQRTIWLEDSDFNKLKIKANAEFEGKGFLEKFLELIANHPTIILRGDSQITITAK